MVCVCARASHRVADGLALALKLGLLVTPTGVGDVLPVLVVEQTAAVHLNSTKDKELNRKWSSVTHQAIEG